MQKSLAEILGVQHPIIMAPMFLVSNAEMIAEALNNGISAAFPALNYRTTNELRDAIRWIKQNSNGKFGVNLIVNQSNYKLPHQLQVCIEEKVQYIITSLGNPKQVIEQCKKHGILVFCDVVDVEYALKVEALGADGVIAVNAQAGGHCGNLSAEELIPLLISKCSIPVISAGGVSLKSDIDKMLHLGAAGVSVGTIFIATHECKVSNAYKQAIVDYGAKDIVLTKKLSGSHLTVINTPYVQELGTEPNFLERMLKRYKWLKKYIKLLIWIKGTKSIEKAAFGTTYQTVWCAGPSIENVKAIRYIKEVISDLTKG
jgi:nitronate monooxygenase